MSPILVVCGNPRPGSRTRTLAVAVGEQIAHRQHTRPPAVVDLGEHGQRLLVPGDGQLIEALAAVRAASVLVIATPTYKGSYTGVLKVFLDNLPHQGLAGIVAVPIAVGATPAQAAQSERHLRGLLTELGADARPGLVATEASLGDPTLANGYVSGLAEPLATRRGLAPRTKRQRCDAGPRTTDGTRAAT